jgi:putative membrane protein insertion efficiency factor
VSELKNGLKNTVAVSLCLCSKHKQKINFLQTLNTINLKSFLQTLTLNNLAKSIVVLYQATISYFLGGNCRYYPSCSHYAVESFEKHNFLYAFYLVLGRLLSCHPFSRKSFYDPVPLTNAERALYE